MAQVPQSTLRYLFYDVLKVQPYRDPNRTYSDIVSTLQRYPGITVKGTKEYVFENGAPQLLLYLGGVLPVSFRGTVYHFPVLIWIPYTYPYDAPILYVNPTDDIAVNPGQHVAPDGKIYHHYLAHWREQWERSNILDFLSLLAEVFAKDPPVRSKPRSRQQQQQQQHHQQQQPPPRPPLPHEAQAPGPQPQSPRAGPPPPPPKEPSANGQATSPAQPRPSRYDAPLPLPPQDSPRPPANYQAQTPQPRSMSHYQPQRSASLRQSHPQPPQSQPPQHWQPPPQHIQQQYQQPPTHNYQSPPPPQQQQQRQQQQPPPQPKSQPAPSLLDSPFDLPLPTTTSQQLSNLPAPPIPRNPEKDALLTHLSSLLTSQLHTQIQHTTTQVPALHSQSHALNTALGNLKSELSNLTALQSTLQSNISAFTTSLSSADSAIQDARNRSSRGDLPAVDAMLTTPHIVSQQLYTLVAEERGIEAAIWGLLEALIRGRVGGEVWSRRTREVAREGFKKRWLVRKIGRGWGLEGA